MFLVCNFYHVLHCTYFSVQGGPFYTGALLVSKSIEFTPRGASLLILLPLKSGHKHKSNRLFILDIHSAPYTIFCTLCLSKKGERVSILLRSTSILTTNINTTCKASVPNISEMLHIHIFLSNFGHKVFSTLEVSISHLPR